MKNHRIIPTMLAAILSLASPISADSLEPSLPPVWILPLAVSVAIAIALPIVTVARRKKQSEDI